MLGADQYDWSVCHSMCMIPKDGPKESPLGLAQEFARCHRMPVTTGVSRHFPPSPPSLPSTLESDSEALGVK